jgi:hypothetical protein
MNAPEPAAPAAADRYGYQRDGEPRWLARLPCSDLPLANPGIGLCTYQRFAGDAQEADDVWNDDGPLAFPCASPPMDSGDGLPRSTVAYFRWYWARIEPQRGCYRWDAIDRALALAASRGQQLHLRMMPHDHRDLIPAWYRGAVHRGRRPGAVTDSVIPDYADPAFRTPMADLVASLAQRYDGHPGLYAVDIGTLGFWGEWHALPGCLGDEALRRWAVDLYRDAFHRTPLLMLIGGEDALRHALGRGCGWRADCWGDMRSGAWNHMSSCYPWALAAAGAGDAWRRAPVALETCWTLVHWRRQGWDAAHILAEAERWHASTLNLKSGVVPEEWRPLMARTLARLGYRFQLRAADCTASAPPGGRAVLRLWWTNAGTAPCYHRVRVVVRLEHAGRTHLTPIPGDPRTWMPGDDQCQELVIALPADLAPGAWQVAVGLCGDDPACCAIRPANLGVDREGWLPVGTLAIAGQD